MAQELEAQKQWFAFLHIITNNDNTSDSGNYTLFIKIPLSERNLQTNYSISLNKMSDIISWVENTCSLPLTSIIGKSYKLWININQYEFDESVRSYFKILESAYFLILIIALYNCHISVAMQK